MANFHFGPANLFGKRGIDENKRMWLRIEVSRATTLAKIMGIPFSYIKKTNG